MKKTFKPALFVLLMCGVFGADEVKAVSVMEGDSVTLNPNRTQIQGFNEILWRFKDSAQSIASVDASKPPKYSEDERFRDRLKLNQTGSLTITNMKTKHSGLYKLQIELNSGSVPVNFAVTVYESPSVIDAVKGEMNFESVMEGDPVTLQTDVTQLSGDELIVWRCGEEGKLIAKSDIEAKSSPFYDTEERFRSRLELDQTGSLIITNTRTTDSGYYTVKISSKKQTVYKRFTVTVSVSEPGLSSGAVAGIVVGVLVFAAAVAAAVAAGVIYHRRQISELQKQILTVTETVPVTVKVKEGEPVTLKPNKEINNDDYILWQFGDEELLTGIAEIHVKTEKIFTHDYAADGIFRGRLYLDTTGSLTISNSRTAHSGLYTLHITSSRGDSEQTFRLTVNETLEEKSVKDGDSVTLNPDPLNPDTEIQGDDQILWMFGDQEDLIAQLRGGTVEIYDGAAGIFRGKLELNKTGSLTITNTEAEHAGLYKLQIITSRRILFKKFRVFIPLRHVLVTVGESVHLSTGLTKIERDGEIQWMFGGENSLIADIKRGTRTTYDVPDGRFGDRLQLDTHTGDLTIKNSTDEHAGCYNLKIRSSKGDTNSTYIVTRARGKSMTKGNNDYTIKPVSESEMRSLLNKQVPDGVNEEERKSSV